MDFPVSENCIKLIVIIMGLPESELYIRKVYLQIWRSRGSLSRDSRDISTTNWHQIYVETTREREREKEMRNYHVKLYISADLPSSVLEGSNLLFLVHREYTTV